jgi:gluconate 2-dehydrogenase gamma chain
VTAVRLRAAIYAAILNLKKNENTTMAITRRSFISTSGQALGAGWLALNWTEIAAAASHAHAAAQSPGPQAFTILSADVARDVDAMCAQIIPTDDAPGAREAGSVYFIDRALGGFFAPHRAEFQADYANFAAVVGKKYAGIRFADLSTAQQMEHLQSIEESGFFGTVRFLTIVGMLVSPGYGGNRDGIGWKLIGFDDQHMFQPPFGFYDRDYPGFVPYATKSGS